ncbi:MAG: hypothetical protein K0R68_4069 [Mycobacterium sp.]|jgi:hypothetical protein|nr:hypothetical protein [Mycobacterium sp.]
MTQPNDPTPNIVYPSGPPGDFDDGSPLYPEGAPGPDGTWQVPQYPPHIPESQFDATQGTPRSTLDGIHGTGDDEPIRWSPSHPGERPPSWMHDYVQDQTDPGLWWPDKGPLAPGSVQPAGLHSGDDKGGNQGGAGESKLDVIPADLSHVGEQYAELQAAAAAIGPQAVDEVNRIIASHGAMGYPVAVGVVTGLARRQAALEKKAADFGVYSTRFTEHAAAYQTGDSDGAQRIQSVSVSDPDDWFTAPGWHDDNVAVDPGGAAAGPNAGPAIPPGLLST